jgi:hypothetical protein
VPAVRVVVPAILAPVIPSVILLGALAVFGGLSFFELKKQIRNIYKIYFDEFFYGF